MEHSMATRSSIHSTASSSGNICIQVDQKWDSDTEEYTFTPEKEQRKMDPHILMILEHFGELYIEQKSTLKTLFKGQRDDMWVEINKIKEEALQIRQRKPNAKVLSRSLSVGSPRRCTDDDDVTRLDRFKIKTLDVKQGGGGGGVKQLTGSK
ncbi:unnamed protein product [Rhodiola kirilowii]